MDDILKEEVVKRGLSFDGVCSLLQETGALLAGGLLTRIAVGCPVRDDVDLDIWVSTAHIDPWRNLLQSVPNLREEMNYRSYDYEGDVEGIEDIRHQTTRWSYFRDDTFVVDLVEIIRKTPRQVVDNFDLTASSVAFDGDQWTIPECVREGWFTVRHIDAATLDRIEKYKSFGLHYVMPNAT
jgi:hypothetical protein